MAYTYQSLMIQQVEGDDDYHEDPLHHQQHNHLHSMSRLSLSSQDHGSAGTGAGSHMSLLSIENFDADEELSDQETADPGKGYSMSSDSDVETGFCSLPATPLRRCRRNPNLQVNKDYASDNELISPAQSDKPRNRTRRRAVKIPPVERSSEPSTDHKNNHDMDTKKEKKKQKDQSYRTSSAGESDHSGVMVITRPKGGRRSLCMDMEEVKACNELGFELEHEHIMPCISINPSGGSSAADFDTSSGNNSPIANWCISSPGDDPRDVKARLKVWAQAVALASTSRKGLDFYS